MISELLAFFLPEGYAVAFRHKEMWSPPPRLVLIQLNSFSWLLSSWSMKSPRMTTRTRPSSPQDEWRDLKWEFLTGLALFAGGRLTARHEPAGPDLYHLRPTLHHIWPRCAPHRPGRPAQSPSRVGLA